ncbi:hypothetical protein AK812_SmicGene1451 [Symbiodinium microadriaticum]|uniref:Uncharacterized protein n=1 Tax=Symbiodinium microadriaticum TaxID=2951 RepID=A0A1Q9F486_SYMMI|nr:hypothetical protein AK812_SmicGene1451 [Symbiodinium microadriaticum]
MAGAPVGTLRREAEYDRLDTEVAGECRRMLGCNLAIAMLCVLFTICCLVVTVLLDPAGSSASAARKPAASFSTPSPLSVAPPPSPSMDPWRPTTATTSAPQEISSTAATSAWKPLPPGNPWQRSAPASSAVVTSATTTIRAAMRDIEPDDVILPPPPAAGAAAVSGCLLQVSWRSHGAATPAELGWYTVAAIDLGHTAFVRRETTPDQEQTALLLLMDFSELGSGLSFDASLTPFRLQAVIVATGAVCRSGAGWVLYFYVLRFMMPGDRVGLLPEVIFTYATYGNLEEPHSQHSNVFVGIAALAKFN